VAGSGDEARALTVAHEGALDLVISDLVMSSASGLDVVERVRARFHGARALLMSGYTDQAVLASGALEESVHFIRKPFAPDTLARRVREVLDG
jgi:DNA-binding NtrC family response regulator